MANQPRPPGTRGVRPEVGEFVVDMSRPLLSSDLAFLVCLSIPRSGSADIDASSKVGFEEGDDGQHPSVVGRGLVQAELPAVTHSFSAIPAFERPSAISVSTSRSRALNASSGSSRRFAETSSWTSTGSTTEPPREGRPRSGVLMCVDPVSGAGNGFVRLGDVGLVRIAGLGHRAGGRCRVHAGHQCQGYCDAHARQGHRKAAHSAVVSLVGHDGSPPVIVVLSAVLLTTSTVIARSGHFIDASGQSAPPTRKQS